MTELTKLIRAALSPPMQFVKLEGDAVFCFAPQEAFPNGELLVELVESCYFDFTNRLLNMTRSTTCTCDACRAIDGLDLKFVAHNGTFIVDRDEDGRLDLAGPEVILVHRLLKNTIIEQGGPSSYGFFTDPVDGRSTEFRLPAHEESVESLRQVTGVVQDLAAVAATTRGSGGSPHRRRRRCCLLVHRRCAARSVLAVLRGTRKATPSRGGCRDGNRVQAEQRGSGRDGSVKPLCSRRRRRWTQGVSRLETL